MFLQCTPIVPVANLKDATNWFETCLGFTAQPVGGDMVHLSRDHVSIRLVRKAVDMDMTDPRRQQSIYINVQDIDLFYAQNKEVLGTCCGTNSCEILDRDYGAREIHIIYESLLIYLGQPIRKD